MEFLFSYLRMWSWIKKSNKVISGACLVIATGRKTFVASNNSTMNIQDPWSQVIDDSNCGYWCVKMKTLLLSQGVYGLVENSYNEPKFRRLF